MKHVYTHNLKSCIFITTDTFNEVLNKIYNNSISVTYDYEGITVENNKTSDTISTSDLLEKLAEYYDVTEVTSIHIDDCEYTGVWICYKTDKNPTETIQKNCNEYNIRAKRNDLHSRIYYLDEQNSLVLATESQMEYNNYQCILATNPEECIRISDSFVKQICFEHGE